MNVLRGTLLTLTILSLAACEPATRSTGTGGTSASQPTTSQAGASESRQAGENMGAGAP